MTEKPQRLYLQIANQLIDKIKSGEYPIGTRLPAERDLATQLEVSRASVREALIALELSELVEIRKGVGVVVIDMPNKPLSVSDPITPDELLEAREVLEPQIAMLAARKATPSDLARLTAIQQTMENALLLSSESLREAVSVDADKQFHAELAHIANNPLLQEIMEKIWSKGARGDLWLRFDQHAHAPSFRPQWVMDHAAILAAIAAGDEMRAYHTAVEHIRNVRDVITNFELM